MVSVLRVDGRDLQAPDGGLSFHADRADHGRLVHDEGAAVTEIVEERHGSGDDARSIIFLRATFSRAPRARAARNYIYTRPRPPQLYFFVIFFDR